MGEGNYGSLCTAESRAKLPGSGSGGRTLQHLPRVHCIYPEHNRVGLGLGLRQAHVHLRPLEQVMWCLPHTPRIKVLHVAT